MLSMDEFPPKLRTISGIQTSQRFKMALDQIFTKFPADMIIRIIVLLGAFFICLSSKAQTFTFDPGDEYEAVLDMETYSDHYIYINHDASDSAYISWRVVGNTCPEEWLISICDWADCYSYLPNTGDMLPVGQGEAGFTKLTMNPLSVPGTGMIHFWIYPTGAIEEHVDMIYYFSTEIVGVNELSLETKIFPQPATNNFVSLLGLKQDDYCLLDLQGSEIMKFRISSPKYDLSLPSLSPGVYLLRNTSGNTYKILIQ